MALDDTGTALNISAEYQTLLDGNYSGDPHGFLRDTLSVIMDAGFQEATPTMSNVNITAPAGSLLFPLVGGSAMALAIGTECARYWSEAISTNGIPVAFPITSVSNDAAKIAQPIADGLMGETGASGPVVPSYLNFVKIIYDEVRTIIWTVEETNPADGSTVSYTVNVT